MLLGITGTTGAGKTTLLEVIEQQGGEVIDCDSVYHELLKSNKELIDKLKEHFGTGILTDGKVDTKKLGKKVFGDKDKLQDLINITFPFITDAVRYRIDTSQRSLVAIDAPLLFESELQGLCSKTIGVLAPIETRISRIMQRDNISKEYALSRIKSQHQDEYFISRCDYILINNFGSKEEFGKQSSLLVHDILKEISTNI